jgi:serine/threonine protein kinase
MVLELLRCSLSDALYKATFRLPWTDELKTKMAQQIADGMAFLHTTKPRITHGDLKPANVMLNARNTCKIIDFGLAAVKESSRMVSNDPRIKAGTGTLPYQAPELLDVKASRNHKIDGRFDRGVFVSCD